MAGAFQLPRSNDLIWSRRLRHYLLDLPDQETDPMSWNADATRMPYRMHAEYPHRLFLRNSLAGSRYIAGAHPVLRSGLEMPVCAVGILTDHVAPWRSVYKIIPLTDTEISFILTSGGHNAGVVSPPGSANRSCQSAVHRPRRAVYRSRPLAGARTASRGQLVAGLAGMAGTPCRLARAATRGRAGRSPAPGSYVLQQ